VPRQDAPPVIVEQEHITRLGAAAVTAFAMYSQPEVVKWKSEMSARVLGDGR